MLMATGVTSLSLATPAVAVGGATGFAHPGPLAEAPTGRLYVASGRALFEWRGREPVVIARGASRIESVVVATDGSIYLGEQNLLQRVAPSGQVSTVARIQVTGLGRGLRGSIYVVSDAAVSRLDGHQLVPVVRRSQFKGITQVPLQLSVLDFANVAFDAHDNIYVTASGVGFGLFEVTSSGRARYVGPARSGGGSPASLTEGAGGRIYLGVQNSVLAVDEGRISVFRSFPVGAVKGISGAFAPRYVAASMSPGSPVYADASGGNGFSNDSAIVAIYPDGRVVTMWAGAA